MDTWTISRENDDEFEEEINEYCEYFAYTIGAILGDGYFHFSPKSHQYRLGIDTMDLEVVQMVAQEINGKLFTDYKIHSYQKKNRNSEYYRFRTSNPDIFYFFYLLTEARTSIPQHLFNADNNVKRRFIAGMFDTDGYAAVNKQPKGDSMHYQVGFSNTNGQIIRGVAKILQMLGVKVGAISVNDNSKSTFYNERTSKLIWRIQPNVRSFIESGCYFNVRRKREILEQYMRHVASETLHAEPSTQG